MEINKRYKQNILIPDQFLTQNEVGCLLKSIDTRTFLGKRDKVILLLFLNTGLRKNELLSLNIENYKKENNDYWLEFKAKGGQIHIQNISQIEVIKAVDSYLKLWKIGNNELEPIFQSTYDCKNKSGKRLSKQSLEFMLKKYGKQAGIQKKLHIHMLRHTAGSEFYRLTQNLPLTQMFLRHKSINSTLIYMHADKTKVKEVQKLMFKN